MNISPYKVTNAEEAPITFEIDRTIFNNEDQRTEDLHLQLSEKYMIYKDLADRCLINPTQIDKGDNRVFYIKPDSVFTQEPRVQNQFRNEFIRQASAAPIPEPFTLMADDLQKIMREDLKDKSTPHHVREQMCQFYQRRQFKLQHKRHKYLSRWSHFALTSELVDKVSLKFSPNFSKIQFELEQAIKRHQRLEGEDHFDSGVPRPQRLEPNGKINPDDINAENLPKNCSLRQDDIDIYMRIVNYEAACNKALERFINRAKWVPLTHRFDVFSQAQERVQNFKHKWVENQKTLLRRIETKGKEIVELKKLGERGYKELAQIKSALPFAKREKQIRNNKDILIESSRLNYDLPPMVIWNQVELKLQLEDLCRDFKIFGDMEVDDGNSFSYSVVVQFPTIFNSQIIKTQFAPYDGVPSKIDPAELGKKYTAENSDLYGDPSSSLATNSLLDQLDIEKRAKQMNIQYINSIEKALFGEFNNGQLEDFPVVRLKKSHWLTYIVFKAEISKQQMQQAALLTNELNPIDQIAANMLEIVNINDINSVNLTLESISQIHYDKLRNGKVRAEFTKLDHMQSESIFDEQQRQFLQMFMSCLRTKSDYGYQGKGIQDENELPKNSLYDTPQHLLLARYLMTCVKAREQKTKLMYTLNAFRSIQKRIALELRELATRDRVSFDTNIVEPKEKSSKRATKETDDIIQNSGMEKETRVDIEDVVMDELIDLNRFRYNGRTQNQMFSTCPVLPKYHVSFGEPIERQEVSTEFEINKDQDPRKGQSQRLLGRIDFISEHSPSGCFIVQDDFGVNVMYDSTFADMRVLEQELVRTMSYFINKLEPIQELDLRNIFPSVDRFFMIKEAITLEESYQRAKLQLVFCYFECYEHTCDTLEQQRIIQIIIDLMAKRPRLNFSANHFEDSYLSEIKLLEMHTKLIREFIKMQMANEFKQNNEIREYLEKTYRLIYEQIDNKWQYYESKDIKDEQEKRKYNALGVKTEEDGLRVKELEGAKPGMFSAKQPTIDPRQFADMLGMPASSLQMLLKQHNERDPLVKQSIHEHVSFIKLQEGYPVFFQETEDGKNTKVRIVPGANEINLLEIYESLSQVTMLSASVYHAIAELNEVHRPDNGLTSSSMDLVVMEFLLAEMRAVGIETCSGDQLMQPRDLDQIEDSSILGNAEKMLFFIKELVASAEDPSLIQNPYLLTKIDLETIQNYNFDLAQGKQFKKKEERSRRLSQMLSIDSIKPTSEKDKGETNEIRKGITEIEEKVEMGIPETTELLEKIFEGNESSMSEESGTEDEFTKKQKLHERNKNKGYPRLKQKILRPNIPSMLEICCNSVEVLRLRHLLIETYNQRSVLVGVYQSQCKILGQEAKIYLKDQFSFETHMNGGTNWKNFVDTGPGQETAIQTDLSIKEFDPSLTSILNFADPEAFKALVCPLGLEELRAVVLYEVMNLHGLVVAVRHNQIILDNCQRQLAELELFAKGFLVSAPCYDIIGKLEGQNLFDANLKRLPEVEISKVKSRISENVSKCAYVLIARKNRPKDRVEKTYQKIRQQIIDNCDEKVEIRLRFLRTCRIMLCHDYCQDVSSSHYMDTIKVELLNEINQIRRRAFILPKDAMLHQIPLSKYGEYSCASQNELHTREREEQEQDWQFWNSDKRKITDFWKLPSFFECCSLDMAYESFSNMNLPTIYAFKLEAEEQMLGNNQLTDDFCTYFKQNQKSILKKRIASVKEIELKDAEKNIEAKGRFVDIRGAFTVADTLVFKYLGYFRNLQNLFDLEYFKSKLSTRSHSMAQLEICVDSGVQFWEANLEPITNNADEKDTEQYKNEDTPYSLQSDEAESVFKNKLAEETVSKIEKLKKHKLQLILEFDSMKEMFDTLSKRMTAQGLKGDLQFASNFLSELQKISFNNIFLGLQHCKENQIKNGIAQKEIQSINELLNLFSHVDETKVTYNNGYHVNVAATNTSRICLESNVQKPDYKSFFIASQPIIDEQGLNPSEFNLLSGMYTVNAIQLKSYRKQRPHIGWIAPRDFHYLDMKLFNVSRELRMYIEANISQTAEAAHTFALAKLKVDSSYYRNNYDQQLEVFQEMKNFTKIQIRSEKLKSQIFILMTKNLPPRDVKNLQALYKEFHNLFNWKVVGKMDELTKYKLMQSAATRKLANAAKNLTPVQKIQQDISGQRKLAPQDSTLGQFETYQCEFDTYQREIMNFMILTSKRLIERETTSLVKAFEMNGKRLEVLIGPQQQFCATLDTTTDKRNHLDIINKVGPLQKMLTQFKNRMLEIDTITSGKGVIISTKDLTECLKECARSIVKNGEMEMRTRCEFLCNQIIHYENTLYQKDQQLLNMESKLKQAKEELNRIVNTRVFARGNQLIYELDHTQRQLRLVKDNVYQMEKLLKDQIRLSFDKDLERARLELEESRKKFSEYQATLNSHLKADITRNFNELDSEMKRQTNQKIKEAAHNPNRVKTFEEMLGENSHLLQGQAKLDYKESQISGQGLSQNSSLNSKDLKLLFKEMERLKASEKEARGEVLELQNLMRKQRMLQNFKWLIAQRKWDFKVDNLKSQLTSNATLWEQLAESEKREQVLKQELQRTQSEVATLDRVLERLKDEVKFEQLEKHKLLKFQETKVKRLTQLEDIAKQMELISNIDLDKLLQSVGVKDAKIKVLQQETHDTEQAIAQIYRNKSKEVKTINQVAQEETKTKLLAFQKIEELRAELQLLQSDDLTSMNLWKEKVIKLKREKNEFRSQLSLLQQEFDQMNQSAFQSIMPKESQINPYHQESKTSHFMSNSKTLMKKVPSVATRVSLDRSIRIKKQNNVSNVFDRLLIESQSISMDIHKTLPQPQITTPYKQVKPADVNFGFQRPSDLNYQSTDFMNPLGSTSLMGPSPGVIRKRNVDVNIFSSLKKQNDRSMNASDVTALLPLGNSKYQSVDALSKQDQEASKRSTVEGILGPINSYQKRDSQMSTENVKSQLASSQYTVSPFQRVPKQVGDRPTNVASVSVQEGQIKNKH